MDLTEYENIKINFEDGMTFETQSEIIRAGSVLSGRMILAIAKDGKLIKHEPASAKSHGFQIWSVPISLVRLVSMVNYGTSERTVERVLSGNLGTENKIHLAQKTIDVGLAALQLLKQKTPATLSQKPEIVIKEMRIKPRPDWYLVTAALKRPIKYLAYLPPVKIIKFVKSPQSQIYSHFREVLVLYIDDVVYSDYLHSIIAGKNTIKQQLEVSSRVPTKRFTTEIRHAIPTAIREGVPISAVLALSK